MTIPNTMVGTAGAVQQHQLLHKKCLACCRIVSTGGTCVPRLVAGVLQHGSAFKADMEECWGASKAHALATALP